jgi:hypothetical protein
LQPGGIAICIAYNSPYITTISYVVATIILHLCSYTNESMRSVVVALYTAEGVACLLTRAAGAPIPPGSGLWRRAVRMGFGSWEVDSTLGIYHARREHGRRWAAVDIRQYFTTPPSAGHRQGLMVRGME